MNLTLNSAAMRAFDRQVAQLADRYESARDGMMRQAANNLRRQLVRRAPGGIPGYPKSLEAVVVPGQQQGWAIVGVVARRKRIMVTPERGAKERMVIYVQPTKVGERKPWIVALSNVIWTMETLPVEPSKKDGRLMTRRVSKREFEWATKESGARREQVGAALEAAGLTLRKSSDPIVRKVELDLAFEVLRAEFGLAGSKADAHWRPAIRAVSIGILRQGLMQATAWLASSKQSRYTPRGNVVKRKVRLKHATAVIGFQDRVKP